MRAPLPLTLVLLTLAQLKSGECRVACNYLGYDGGYYMNKTAQISEQVCVCSDYKSYTDVTNRHPIRLPNRKHEPSSPAPQPRGYSPWMGGAKSSSSED